MRDYEQNGIQVAYDNFDSSHEPWTCLPFIYDHNADEADLLSWEAVTDHNKGLIRGALNLSENRF